MNHYEEALVRLFAGTVAFLDFRQKRRRLAADGYLKNFDFIIFSRRGRYLVDVKGKTFPSGKNFVLETSLWRQATTLTDLPELDSYIKWTELFGSDFQFLLAYPYWIKKGIEDLERFEKRLRKSSEDDRLEVFHDGGRVYALLAVTLENFLATFNIGARHPRLRASGESNFKPLGFFVPEIESHPCVYSRRKIFTGATPSS